MESVGFFRQTSGHSHVGVCLTNQSTIMTAWQDTGVPPVSQVIRSYFYVYLRKITYGGESTVAIC